MKALILVDVQNDFLPGGRLPVTKGDEIIPVINALIPHFELVVATQDWHPQNHVSFVSNHLNKNPFDKIEISGLDQILWPDHCVQGTEGAEFSKQLNTNRVEAIFRKGTDPKIDSYSGFFDNNHRKSTGLADYLRGKRVDTLYITGLAGDVCVYFTALNAIEAGFATMLVEDATMPLDLDTFAKNRDEIKMRGGKVVRSEECL